MGETDKPRIGLLVIDLDDTAWTWFDSWHASLSALVNGICATSGIDEDTLLAAIKGVHEDKGTTEYSWLVDELDVLRPFAAGRPAKDVFDSALHAQNHARIANIALYPGVLATLKTIKAAGAKVVAYTESLEYWTEWRVRHTQLDGLIDYLYSSPDHDFPKGESRATVRTLPKSEYGLKQTVHKQVPRGINKPDPAILEIIVARHGVPGLGVAYVGDSLDRDVAMAQAVSSVYDVHAAYGQTFEKPGYELLKRVTHWTDEEVQREHESASNRTVRANIALYEGFHQLLDHFQFGPKTDVPATVEAWKQTVAVQMHFNDINLRLRALALTVLTFTLGATGYVLVNTDSVSIFGFQISGAVAVPIIGMILWSAFWFMDGSWYHRLLYGSVKEGERLESVLQQNSVNVALGATISRWSALDRATSKGATGWIWRKLHLPPTTLHAGNKLPAFYRIGLGALVFAVALVLLYSFSTDHPPTMEPDGKPSAVIQHTEHPRP